MGFAIVVDSTCDLTLDEYRDLDVNMVPLNILIDGTSYKDQIEISSEEFYRKMAEAHALPKTAAPSPYEFQRVYEDLAAQGYDAIISVHLAGVLSGTVQAASVAAEQVAADVRVVDTLSATAPMALMVKELVRLRNSGVSADDAEVTLRGRINTDRFIVVPETLDNLLKGGRLSEDQVTNVSKLNIKLLFTITDEGTITAFGKAKGMRGAVREMAAEVARRVDEQGPQRVRFAHVDNERGVADIKAQLDKLGVPWIDEGTAPCGATVATHFGAGAVALGCMAE